MPLGSSIQVHWEEVADSADAIAEHRSKVWKQAKVEQTHTQKFCSVQGEARFTVVCLRYSDGDSRLNVVCGRPLLGKPVEIWLIPTDPEFLAMETKHAAMSQVKVAAANAMNCKLLQEDSTVLVWANSGECSICL